MASRYEMVIYWSEEDQRFIAEVPELPSCMAGGTTYQEAVSVAGTVIVGRMETAKKLGRPIPQPHDRLMYA